MKIAVIENEYGAVSIDTALVEENVREVRDGGGGVAKPVSSDFSPLSARRGAHALPAALSGLGGGLRATKSIVQYE